MESISQMPVAQQRTHFDRVAREYDESVRPKRYDLDYSALDHYVSLQSLSLILDLATGTGKVVDGILARAPQCVGIGVDISKNMLGIASSKAFEAGKAARFRVANANIMQVPFANNVFDLVSIGYALHHFQPSLRLFVLREAFRVLRSNGYIAIMEIGRDHFVEALSSLGEIGCEKLKERIQPCDVENALTEAGFSLLATILRTERVKMIRMQVVEYLRVQGIVTDGPYLCLLTSKLPELLEITHQRYLCIGVRR